MGLTLTWVIDEEISGECRHDGGPASLLLMKGVEREENEGRNAIPRPARSSAPPPIFPIDFPSKSRRRHRRLSLSLSTVLCVYPFYGP